MYTETLTHVQKEEKSAWLKRQTNKQFFDHSEYISLFFPSTNNLSLEWKETTQSNLLESKQAFKTSLVSAAQISELVSQSAHSSDQDLNPLGLSWWIGGGEESEWCFSSA